MPIERAAIVGAGVAGLTLALSLADRGIHSDILEQADTLTDVGAGLQISPNASRILERIGILARLRPVWTEPESVDLRSGLTLQTLASVPIGRSAQERWKAPYGVLHRATLQGALLGAVTANPLCRLHLGSRIDPVVSGTIDTRLGFRPDVIVGADGIWSACRALVPDHPAVTFSGSIAWRFILPFSEAPAFLPRDRVVAFMGPGAHLVCYPLTDGGGFNLVAITAGRNPGRTWAATETNSQGPTLLDRFARWNPALRALVEGQQNPLFWPLYQAGPGRWQDGERVVLIGDAAHAMMPFMAQGAAMAIEDADALAHHLAVSPVPAALGAFEQERKPRVARVARRVAFNRFVYHARGPLRIGRDLAMAMRPSHAYQADFDWLYGYGQPG